MPERVVVSRTSYVDPAKIGKRRTRSPAAIRDRQTADAVIEDSSTVRYRTILGPRTPSAPPEDYPPPPVVDPDPPVVRRPDTDFEPGLCVCLGFIVFVFAVCAGLQPAKGTLISADWNFVGHVEIQKLQTEGGWTIPPTGTKISEELRFFQWVTVVDRVDIICNDEPRTRKEYSHTIEHCSDEFSHYAPDEEVYSHTEEVCYSDGTCEKDDVYKKKSGKAVYVWRCHHTPHYRDVMYWENVCKNVPVTHREEDIRPHYTFEIMRWVHERFASTNSTGVQPMDLLLAGERFGKEQWTYVLQFKDQNATKIVGKPTYEEYKDKIGQFLSIP